MNCVDDMRYYNVILKNKHIKCKIISKDVSFHSNFWGLTDNKFCGKIRVKRER